MDQLRGRGYSARAIDTIYCKVSLNHRGKLLEPKVTIKADNLNPFTLYYGCVFSSTNAPGISLLQEYMDLSIQRLQEEADGYIFTLRAFFTRRSVPTRTVTSTGRPENASRNL